MFSRKHHSGGIGVRSLLFFHPGQTKPTLVSSILLLSRLCQGFLSPTCPVITYVACVFLMLVSIIQIYQCLYIQNLRLVTGGLELHPDKLELEKSLTFRICLALPGGSRVKTLTKSEI